MGKSIWIINQDVLTPKYGYMQHRHYYIASELQRMGYDVNILTSNYSHFVSNPPPSGKTYNFEKINDVLFCWIKGLKYGKPNGIKRILGWMHFTFLLFFLPKKKLNKPDLIIFSSTGLFSFLAALYYKMRYKARLVVETRDIWPMTLVEVGKISPKHPLILLIGMLEKLSYRKADGIVGTMPNLTARIKEITNRNVPFVCIPQGIDLSFIKSLRKLDEDYVKTYLPPNNFTIGYAGTIGTSNVLEDLIAAARRLKNEIPELRIVLVGDGTRKKELQQLCEDLPFIVFAPKIPKEQVNDFLQRCDLLFDGVYPASIYKYGISRNKWVDYMYSAKPVIVSYSGFLSMLNESGCGEAIPVGDINALVSAVKKYHGMTSQQRADIGRLGHDYILANRTFDKITARYDELFQALL